MAAQSGLVRSRAGRLQKLKQGDESAQKLPRKETKDAGAIIRPSKKQINQQTALGNIVLFF
jgi:hypothetical protein